VRSRKLLNEAASRQLIKMFSEFAGADMAAGIAEAHA